MMRNVKSRRPCHQSGFTLVELLVVISIAGVLAALLFSVFSRVRQNANRSSCQSNLRQIGLAMQQYLSDADNIYPLQDQTPGAERTFVAALQPYIQSRQIFICPSDTGQTTTIIPDVTDSRDYVWQADGFSGSYSMNALVQGLPLSFVPKPDITALFVDNRTFADFGYYPHLQYCGRHFGGVNVNYVDGHVKWMPLRRAVDQLNFFIN